MIVLGIVGGIKGRSESNIFANSYTVGLVAEGELIMRTKDNGVAVNMGTKECSGSRLELSQALAAH